MDLILRITSGNENGSRIVKQYCRPDRKDTEVHDRMTQVGGPYGPVSDVHSRPDRAAEEYAALLRENLFYQSLFPTHTAVAELEPERGRRLGGYFPELDLRLARHYYPARRPREASPNSEK